MKVKASCKKCYCSYYILCLEFLFIRGIFRCCYSMRVSFLGNQLLKKHKTCLAKYFQEISPSWMYHCFNCTLTPLHMPKTLEMCKKKTLPCLIRKASRHSADCTSKTRSFLYFTGLVEKIVLYLQFLYTKNGRLHQIKTKDE